MSDAAPTPATTPTKIEQRGPRTLGIAWADGAESLLDVRELRLACGCAQCVDEWTGAERLDASAVPADVHPVKISGVGRYAIQIEWSDGHASGIYPFRRLRALGEGAAAARR
jgi:ATP-binding protein involved in chromosome partitioning